MTRRSQLTALLILAGAFHSGAGTLSYVAVSPVQSDINSGIDSRIQYTTAVDGGNASGNDRVINGVRLYSLNGSGQSAAADNCSLNALTGTLANSQRSNGAPQADGIFAEALSDMISNEGASDNSQQEIVLDPASLTAGTAYDLRIYIANSGVQDREVNLSFVGDGQAPVETGFFNEEDARTSPGAFRDPNQLYYIDYQFTWDGASTPGATITQKSGQAPFVFYAMTNQPVPEEVAAAPAAPVAPVAPAVTTGLVSAVPDQVGVTSDTFYSNESLKKHGRWIEVKKYGRCWQPTDAPPDWRPYSRGHFAYSDDGGYVWISDSSENEWGWATYHYGRWCRVVGVGSGWAWVPGTAWSGAWVSWRQGRDREHGFVGWAPLPPEATLRVGVGISTWADREYDIGPDYYTFVNVRDFGSDSYWRPGLIVDRRRYVDILPNTVNITNINYTSTNGNVSNVTITQVRAYNGGPDFSFINTEIRQSGGREITRIRVDRVGNENFNGAAGSQLQGNTFTVFTPHVKREANPAVLPKVAATVPDNKIDHGWADIKNQKIQAQLRNDIAQQAKGQTPATTKAVLPPQVIQAAAQSTTTTASPGQSPQTASATTIPTTSPSATAPGQVAGTGSTPPLPTSPARSPSGAVANAAPSPGASRPATAIKGLHPGEKVTTTPAIATGRATPPPTGSATPASGAAVTSALSAETQQSAPPKILHPGAKVGSTPAQSPGVAANAVSPSATAGAAQSPAGRAQHPGEKIVSAPGQSPATIRAASPTPPKSATIATPSPAVALHPGAKTATTPARSSTPGVAGTNAPPARNVQTRGAVTAASASPTPQVTPPAVGRQNQPRGRAENKAPLTTTPSQAQVANTPPQLPATARTPAPARAVETVQTPPPVQTPAVTKKVTAPVVTRESSPPASSGPSQQQLQQQQIEERIRQQQQQKQQEQTEQKVQQQQTQQRQQQQLEQEQKLKLQEQKQAQQKQQQEATQLKERQAQQQQAEQKRLQQEAQAKQQEAAQQKQRQQEQAQQKQAEQKKELQQQQALQKQQEAAQQKERQAQQLKEQQAQQRQQELKQQQQAQQKEQQLLKQQQLQQQAEQRQQQQLKQQQLEQQQLKQQQMQQQAQQQQQRQQQQQQNRRAATPTPSPGG